ncbi:MAG: DUF2974 domain-containing protein [Lachnospiraceae bacterium]|nr:DUF2974 domain-containing protein [Lachnospiraceae bacterium]
MGNIIDYIEKYGAASFEEKPFNKVDALILSQFSYLKLGGKVPGIGTMEDGITIRALSEDENVADLFTDERYRKNNTELFEAMAASKRFGNVRLDHYINLVSNKWEMQFSALTAYLAEGVTHVIFRGTDETIVGWKEDFNMAFMTPVPAQVKAVDYLHYAAERIKGDFSVGGHSKGGNLAVYSAMKCSKLVRDRISVIYSQDGPGFTKETLDDTDFNAVKDRIQKYVPRSSIVGMLLQTSEEYKVIEARSVGILQHDPFNWIVEGDDFVYRNDVSERYEISDASVNEWAKRADPEEMKVFIDKIYEVFVAAGVNDLNDFKGNVSAILLNAKSVMDGMDEEDKNRIKAVLALFVDSVKDNFMEQLKGLVHFK